MKEVDLAIVADLGILQRLPRLIGEGLADIAERNAVSLFCADLDEAIAARREKRAPRFEV